LIALSTDSVKEGFQVGDSNPMVGCEGRASLMGGLGRTLLLSPDIYTRNGTTRFGNILDFLLEKAGGRFIT